VLYTGPAGLVAHECILDLRDITAATRFEVAPFLELDGEPG
jgi:hypothetical protein